MGKGGERISICNYLLTVSLLVNFGQAVWLFTMTWANMNARNGEAKRLFNIIMEAELACLDVDWATGTGNNLERVVKILMKAYQRGEGE